MTKSKGVQWTLFDDALLREQVTAGTPRKIIARKLGRSEGAVRMRAKFMGLCFPHSLRSQMWSLFEDEQIKMFAAAGRSVAEAAYYLDRTMTALHSRAKRQRIHFRMNSVRNNGWTIEQDDELRALAAKGHDKIEIAAQLTVKRTPFAVRRRATQLQIQVRYTSHPASGGSSRWPPERIKEASDLWQAGWSGKAISDKFGHGFTRSAVIAKIHRYGCGKRVQKQKTQPRKGTANQKRQRAVFNKPQRVKMAPRPPRLRKNDYRIQPPGITTLSAWLPPEAAQNDVARVRHEDLASCHCRWPKGDPKTAIPRGQPLFCGEKRVAGLAYCAEHNQRAYYEVSSVPRLFYPDDAKDAA